MGNALIDPMTRGLTKFVYMIFPTDSLPMLVKVHGQTRKQVESGASVFGHTHLLLKKYKRNSMFPAMHYQRKYSCLTSLYKNFNLEVEISKMLSVNCVKRANHKHSIQWKQTA